MLSYQVKSLPFRLILKVRAHAHKAQHRGKEQGVEGTVHRFPSCVSREVTLKAGYEGSIGVLLDGGRVPCGRNSQSLVLLDAPFSIAASDRFQSFPCQGLIPTSGVNEWSPQLAPPGP